MQHAASTFRQHNFLHVPAGLSAPVFGRLDAACGVLFDRGARVLTEIGTGAADWSAYYRAHPDELIVVPELADPRQICRLEYLAGCSSVISEIARIELARQIEDVLGAPVVLFKDKCNFKLPGGGAFGPHQDIVAYRHFAAPYHVTAAVMLDPATIENGCLEVAYDYRSKVDEYEVRDTPLGWLPIFPYATSGATNGDISPEVASRLRWEPIVAARGDVILFDSFVPHRSVANRSVASRRMLFFTFNLRSAGEHYEAYYRAKHEDSDSPIFHVSTPTLHRGWPS